MYSRYDQRRIAQVVLLVFVRLSHVDCQISRKVVDANGKGAWAHSTEIKIQCFSADSIIQLSNGETRKIESLRSGDRVLTIHRSSLSSTEMILMLDRQRVTETEFYRLTTESNHEISLTEHHLIPIASLDGGEIYLFARQIQVGDLLFVVSNNKVNHSRVITIIREIKAGYYAPLTTKGTILINSIWASCFAHVNDHDSAQFHMFPIRFSYELLKFMHLNYLLDLSKAQGLHWTASIMFRFARMFRSSALCLQ